MCNDAFYPFNPMPGHTHRRTTHGHMYDSANTRPPPHTTWAHVRLGQHQASAAHSTTPGRPKVRHWRAPSVFTRTEQPPQFLPGLSNPVRPTIPPPNVAPEFRTCDLALIPVVGGLPAQVTHLRITLRVSSINYEVLRVWQSHLCHNSSYV